MNEKVLKQALEALESLFSGQIDEQRGKRCSDAIIALRAAIDAEQAKGREAVALKWHWYSDSDGYLQSDCIPPPFGGMQEGQGVMLYTTPPAQPAQDESAGSNAQQQSDAELQPARDRVVITEGTAAAYLHDLCEALNNAFISTWKSTHAWQKQLDAANEYLREKNAGQPVVKEN